MSFASSGVDTKEQIKQAVDIVDLVSDYLSLQRDGRNYKGLCPWHDDSRPSLTVNQERQSFKCWVCDIGGDIFTFVERIEGVEFREALSMLAQRAGIPLTRQKPAAGEAAGTDEKQLFYQAMAWAEEQYHQCLLHAPEAEVARRYLHQRGITPESIEQFRLGFAPQEWDWLLRRAQRTTFSPTLLEKVGLVAPRRTGTGHYDRFRGRVLFSIRDAQRISRPVALGGRVLPELAAKDDAKYINSPETPLFSKHRMLYALDAARDAIARTGTVLVMEGYTDCIVAHQHGLENSVAVLGTALGEHHVKLLKSRAERIVLVLDGDAAGQRRAGEVLPLFLAEQVEMQVLTLPEGLDPCDFLLCHGAEAFQQALQQAPDALEHKLRLATGGLHAGSSIHQLERAAEEVLSTLAMAPRLQSGTTGRLRMREEQVLQRLARHCGISEESLRVRLKELRQTGRSRRMSREEQPQPASPRRPMPALERCLLELLLAAPRLLETVRQEISPDQLQSESARIMLLKCCELADAGQEPTFERLMLEFDQQDLKSLLVGLDEQVRERPATDADRDLGQLLERFRSDRFQQEFSPINAAIQQRQLSQEQEEEAFFLLMRHRKSQFTQSQPDKP